MTRPFFTPSPIIRQLVAKVITGQFQNTDMFYVMSNDVMSCHLAVVASQRLATRMSLILKSNTLRLLLCVVGYHLIDQSTDKYCPTSTFVVFHGFSPLPRDLPLHCFQRYHVTASTRVQSLRDLM